MRKILHLVSLLSLAIAAPAFAKTKSTNPTFVARQAFQDLLKKETGKAPTGKAVHAKSIRSVGDLEQTMLWQGRERGPGGNRKNWAGPFGVRLALVPLKDNLTSAQMLAGTKISKDLTQAGEAKVRAHLASKGLAVKTVRLGDFAKPIFNEWKGKSGQNRKLQQPITREAGSLRYTVEFKNGTSRRYLVETNARNLVRGRSVLTKVTADRDFRDLPAKR